MIRRQQGDDWRERHADRRQSGRKNSSPPKWRCLRFAGRTIVTPLSGRDILPVLSSARLLGSGSTSETYGPGTLTDQRSLGIVSETTQTGIPAGRALLTRGSRSRVGAIRPIPASSVASATCWRRHIACKLPHGKHQFSPTISETRFSKCRTRISIARRRPRRLECSYGCGQHDKRSSVCASQLSPRQRKHNLPDQLRVHPRSNRIGIAWSNTGRWLRSHRPYR